MTNILPYNPAMAKTGQAWKWIVVVATAAGIALSFIFGARSATPVSPAAIPARKNGLPVLPESFIPPNTPEPAWLSQFKARAEIKKWLAQYGQETVFAAIPGQEGKAVAKLRMEDGRYVCLMVESGKDPETDQDFSIIQTFGLADSEVYGPLSVKLAECMPEQLGNFFAAIPESQWQNFRSWESVNDRPAIATFYNTTAAMMGWYKNGVMYRENTFQPSNVNIMADGSAAEVFKRNGKYVDGIGYKLRDAAGHEGLQLVFKNDQIIEIHYDPGALERFDKHLNHYAPHIPRVQGLLTHEQALESAINFRGSR